MKLFIFLFMLLTIAPLANAQDFYVAKTGASDSNPGTEALPFLTIQKCFDTLMSRNTPGDTCFVKNGTYTEAPDFSGNLNTASCTTFVAYISIKNYPGHAPIVSGIAGNNGVSLNGNGAGRACYIWFEGFEIRNAGASGLKLSLEHSVIRGNYIHNNASGVGVLGGGWANTFERNRVSQNGPQTGNNQYHGMYWFGQDNKIINNIIEGNDAYGLQAAADPFTTQPLSTYAGFTNNLIAYNVFAYEMVRGAIVFDNRGGGITGNRVHGNIFFQNNMSISPPGGAALDIAQGDTVSFTATNNIQYGQGPSGNEMLYSGNLGTCSGCTITNNTIGTNPAFQNAVPSARPSSPDFHLTTSSILDTGLNLTLCGITTDFSGSSRPTGSSPCASPTTVSPWDIGAYEFGGADTTAPAAPTGLTIN